MTEQQNARPATATEDALPATEAVSNQPKPLHVELGIQKNENAVQHAARLVRELPHLIGQRYELATNIANLNSHRLTLEDWIAQVKTQFMLQVTDQTDASGKKVYSNEQARQAAVKKMMDENPAVLTTQADLDRTIIDIRGMGLQLDYLNDMKNFCQNTIRFVAGLAEHEV